MADVHDFSEKMKARAAAEKAALDAGTLIRSDKGNLVACEHNAFVLVDNAPQYAGLHFDEFLARQRLGARDWLDSDDIACLIWLQRTHAARFNLGHARMGCRSVAYARKRDSLKEFIEVLPAWDETPRIEAAFSDAWGAPESELTPGPWCREARLTPCGASKARRGRTRADPCARWARAFTRRYPRRSEPQTSSGNCAGCGSRS